MKLYKLLGVSSNATSAEIKAAYRSQTLLLHPDRQPQSLSAEQKAKNLAHFISVKNAYDALKDPVIRSKYDARFGYSNTQVHPQRPSADFSQWTSNTNSNTSSCKSANNFPPEAEGEEEEETQQSFASAKNKIKWLWRLFGLNSTSKSYRWNTETIRIFGFLGLGVSAFIGAAYFLYDAMSLDPDKVKIREKAAKKVWEDLSKIPTALPRLQIHPEVIASKVSDIPVPSSNLQLDPRIGVFINVAHERTLQNAQLILKDDLAHQKIINPNEDDTEQIN
ncbi:hypothetical protein HK100_005104 [Physocladia obscura]|uniref:J domain-containing protein n=1 Tax=Physocladia obscura TaxID=109957 RepID=A0AAD5X9J5_9FUNG|nr:hypothetical protein HK100_005104 [Physocladia obscura]